MRNHFTEEEHIKAVKLREEFCENLAKLAAGYIAQFDPEIEDLIMAFFQDNVAWYFVKVAKRMLKEETYKLIMGEANSQFERKE